MIYNKGDGKKEVSLSIKTVIIDEENPDLVAKEIEKLLQKAMKDEIKEEDITSALGSDATDEIELCTEGFIDTNERGQVVISYKENEDDPVTSTLSKIIFPYDDPSLLIMSKEGAIRAVLSFEEGKTHVCTYNTPYMPFKVYVTTKKLSNRLLENGKMKLDYILHINDTAPQHFVITVTLKEAPEDIFKGMF